MTWSDLLLIGLAGAAAGLINAVVGSGTLITFPTLIALGIPPVIANVSNTIGLAPGALSGTLAGKADLVGQRARLMKLGSMSLLGSIGGAVLLLRLPPSSFRVIVPALLGVGIVLVITGQWLSRFISRYRARHLSRAGDHTPPWLLVVTFVTGAYGGYFGAAQGVLLLAVLGVALTETLPRTNALKNALAMVANTVAGLVFALVTEVNWWVVGAIALGSVLGAQLGPLIGRLLPPVIYRVFIVVVGLAAIINLVR